MHKRETRHYYVTFSREGRRKDERERDRLRNSHKSDLARKHVKPKSKIFEIDGVTPPLGRMGEQYL